MYNNMPREELQPVNSYVLENTGFEIKEIELEAGKTAYAVIKAISVMIGVDDWKSFVNKRYCTI